MKIERTGFGGWTNCYRLTNEYLSLIALADVGPRIIQLGPDPEHNCFYVDPATLGQQGGNNWNLFGGHRLWHAPEALPRSYQPDNQPVNVSVEESGVTLTQPVEAVTGIQKQIEIRLSDGKPDVTVIHRLTNHNVWPVTLSPWALSVMAPGGVGVLPLPPRGSHDENLLPTGSLVLWAYVEMNDRRYSWGREFVMLRQEAMASTPQKIGLTASGGWVAYVVDNMLFVKLFEETVEAPYPDRGCTVELFTNSVMLELETLGPMTTLQPDETITHVERWCLWSGIPTIESEEDIRKYVLPRIDSIGAI
jgi:hypothetical protein